MRKPRRFFRCRNRQQTVLVLVLLILCLILLICYFPFWLILAALVAVGLLLFWDRC